MRICRRIAQRFAKFVDCCVEGVVEIDKRIGGPQPAAQFVASNHRARLAPAKLPELAAAALAALAEFPICEARHFGNLLRRLRNVRRKNS